MFFSQRGATQNRILFQLFIFGQLLLSGSWAAIPSRVDLYSENNVLGRENQITNSTRLRTESEASTDTLFFPYVTAGTELASPGNGIYTLDPGSYAYGGAGLKFGWGPIALRGEGRFRKLLRNDYPTFPTIDMRVSAVYGAWLQQNLVWGPQWSLFAEPYSETVFTSADRSNVVHSSYVRAGLRFTAGRATFIDALVEPYLTLDLNRHFYNNRADIKPGVRFVQWFGPVSLSVTANYVLNTYFARGNAEPNPYRDRHSSFRVLGVVGGFF